MVEDKHKTDKLERLRVLHIVSGDLWAGAEVQVWQLLRIMRRLSGVEIQAVVLNSGMLAQRLATDGIEVTVLEESRQSFFQLAREIRRLTQRWQPDIIHTHRRKEHMLGAIAASGVKAKAVATIHGRNEFNHPWWQLHKVLARALESVTLRTAHQKIIAVSDEVAQSLRMPRARTTVVPNGIDVEQIRESANVALEPGDFKVGTVTLGFVGRLVPVKQVDRIIETLALLQNESREYWRLEIIGDGPLRQTLEEHARIIGVRNAVDFKGFQSNPLPLLARFDLLIFASIHEGLPMTALEALALGVPIVAPPLQGLAQVITDSRYGVIASSSQPHKLAQAVRTATSQFDIPFKSRSSKLPCRYTIASSTERTLCVYESLLQDNHPSPG